jgi:serine protease
VFAGLLGAATLATVASPSAVAGATTTPSVVLTVPTAAHHAYRHGAVPRKTRDVVGVQALGFSPTAPGAEADIAKASKAKLVRYGGGLTAGGLTAAGVTTGQPKVYLVLMGSQWGTETTNGSGLHVFSGDPDSFAPALQKLYGGLGTDGETWSGVLTQYCDGAPVAATGCTQGDAQIPYPSGGALAGVWYDSSSTSTSEETAGLTGHQLAAEAEAAATHFGNTTQAENRDTQYVIASPTLTDPDGWNDPVSGYCAYHDDSHDPSIDGGGPVAGPIVAFTNLPYVPDAGYSCGAGTVNSPGILDGATEAASHEYAETMSDQFPETSPPGGWTSKSGEEIADLCAYVATGPGAMFNLTLATGTVTVQGLWSNQTDNCADGAPVFTYTPSVTSFSPTKAAAGSSVTVTGANLGGATSVTFAGTPAVVTADTPTSLTVTVPSGSANGTIAVTTAGGTASSAKSFSVVPSVTSFAPTTVSIGGTLTINGSGLGSAKKVLVGGKKAVITSDTVTQIVVTVPAKAVTGSVTVSTKYGSYTLGGLTID